MLRLTRIAKDYQQFPRARKEAWDRFSLNYQREPTTHTLILNFQPPELDCLSHSVCVTLLLQPWGPIKEKKLDYTLACCLNPEGATMRDLYGEDSHRGPSQDKGSPTSLQQLLWPQILGDEHLD